MPKSFEDTVTIAAPPARVFALWADAPSWPSWDPDLAEARLDGPFEVGTPGSIKPVKGPRTRIRLTEVTTDRSFAALATLPLCRMVFEHRIEPDPNGCRVTHEVRFAGPLAALFGMLIGPSIRRGLPGTMAGLKRAAVAGG